MKKERRGKERRREERKDKERRGEKRGKIRKGEERRGEEKRGDDWTIRDCMLPSNPSSSFSFFYYKILPSTSKSVLSPVIQPELKFNQPFLE